ncbi:MAG: iron-sulfur cluster repair di-iron protein [Deltaproteobacteria bacterium]|nr:iron-sulfur cluster repair di-iron protein [Deltaproteobacteria bacterium]
MDRTPSEKADDPRTVGDCVAEDYRTAKVFEKYGIDFCCGGQSIIAAACRQKGLDPQELYRELDAVKGQPLQRMDNFAEWDLPSLIDHIVATHHAYLWANNPRILDHARKIAQVHGLNHPEVIEIAALFEKIAGDMEGHLKEEEEVLFPAIKRLHAAQGEKQAADLDRAAIRASLTRLYREHQEVGDAVHRIRSLSGGYAIPPDACRTYEVTYRQLKDFEEDLHKHVHLENNILFLKAARL